MASTHLLPPATKDFNDAKRMYMEQYGSALVTNTYLKIALLCLSLVALGLLVLNIKTTQMFRSFKPMVIRINEIGRAESVNYRDLAYKPQETEVRYFLNQFVADYYSRMRATVKNNYSRSLYFLDGRLTDATIERNKKSKEIETFLAGSGDEVDVVVNNVAIEDFRTSPYRATVDFEKIFYGADHSEVRRQKYIGNFTFIIRDQVPNSLVPINPLGLTITYFREDAAFEGTKR